MSAPGAAHPAEPRRWPGSGGRRSGPATSPDVAARRGTWVTAAALFTGALLISAVTLRRTLDPFDEGLLLQAATRIAAGEWPYADFGWAYGPGHPLVNALFFEVGEPTVVAWRGLRAVADASVAVLVWRLVGAQGAGPRWALAGGVAAALTMAQPSTANPFAVAFALALGALACAASGRPVPAGLLVGLAAFWRPDFGVFAALAVVAALLAAGGNRPPAADEPGGAAASSARPAIRPAALAVLVAVAAAAALYLPFAVATGPAGLWDALVTDSLRDGAAWRLPFPLLYDGPLRAGSLLRDGKDLLGYQLPVIALAGIALALVAARRRRSPATVGLLVLGVAGLVYLVGRADDLHQQPLVVVTCALAAGLAPAARRPVRDGLVAVLGLIALAGALNLASSVLRPPAGAAVHLPGVPGTLVDPAEARALPALAADVRRRVPPGEPIYVAPRRGDVVTLTNPLIHFLVRRPNVLDRDAQVLNDPAEQAAVVAALRADPPRVVVRWTDPRSSRPEPNARGRPSGATALDAFLGERYALVARHGAYDVLERR